MKKKAGIDTRQLRKYLEEEKQKRAARRKTILIPSRDVDAPSIDLGQLRDAVVELTAAIKDLVDEMRRPAILERGSLAARAFKRNG